MIVASSQALAEQAPGSRFYPQEGETENKLEKLHLNPFFLLFFCPTNTKPVFYQSIHGYPLCAYLVIHCLVTRTQG